MDLDAIKSRTMAFYDNLYEFLVGCPLDRWAKASLGLIYVYSYADKRSLNWTTEDYQRMLPYRSQRGYSRGAVD